MKSLSGILEGIEDDLEVHVDFSNGDIFGLTNFEMVDESIYQRQDLCLADIGSKVRVGNEAQGVTLRLP